MTTAAPVLVIGVCLFLSTGGGGYARLSYGLGHRLPLRPVALALDQVWGPSLALLGVVILLFPDGRLRSRFWQWTLRVYAVLFAAELVATAAAIAGALAAHPVRVDRTGGLTVVDHPVGWFSAVQGPLTGAVHLLSLASGAAITIACLVLGGTWGSAGGHPRRS